MPNSVRELFEVIAQLAAKPARKISPFLLYQREHWDERIAPTVAIELAADLAKATADGSTLDERARKALQMTVQQRVARLKWANEPTAFQDQIALAAKEEQEEQQAELKKLMESPRTPEEYHKYVTVVFTYYGFH